MTDIRCIKCYRCGTIVDVDAYEQATGEKYTKCAKCGEDLIHGYSWRFTITDTDTPEKTYYREGWTEEKEGEQ